MPGHPVTGPARPAADRHLQSFGLPVEARPPHAYVAGDLALLIVDRSMRGTARDGNEVDLSGTASDVVRRGADERWRHVIDNPTAPPGRRVIRRVIRDGPGPGGSAGTPRSPR
ncbi:hypothetical protein GCM10023334_047440 [Nonomuraea thailandensis]